MTHPFVQFLVERDLVPPNIAKRLTEKNRHVRDPIGMIAVGHGMLRLDDIDLILDRQRECKQRFGDIAVETGLLARDKVETLAKIQEFRTSADIAEALALSGVFSCDDAVQYLGAYLLRDREIVEMISDG